MSKSVLVAMSGGVDSTMAAYLLKDAGFEVKGIHFRFWKWMGNDVDYEEETNHLHHLADQIGIKILEVDARKEFRERVIGQMFDLLDEGLTPNPCIHCNPSMKFDQLLDHAEKERAEYVATGHYVISHLTSGNYIGLFKAKDKTKDQSYFLCQLDQKILIKSIFPLGETRKKENVQKAEELGFSFENKPESQDLCFLTNRSYADFINTELPEIMRPGEIEDTSGKVIGMHHGLPNYTIGQRKGIEIPSKYPYYVVKKDTVNNVLIVGRVEELKFNHMIVSEINWISGKPLDQLSCNVKIRYRSPDYSCELTRIGQFNYRVETSQNIRDITPGQYAVFYQGEEMLGGGMIRSMD